MIGAAANDNVRVHAELVVPLHNLKTALGVYRAWQRAETKSGRLDAAAAVITPAFCAFDRARHAWDAHSSASNTARLKSAANRYYQKLCEVLERWGSPC